MKGGEKLKNGQEVFINYGYIQQNEFPHDLPWYWRMKAKADIELEETEKKNTLVATMLLFGANLGENKQRQAGALSLWLD